MPSAAQFAAECGDNRRTMSAVVAPRERAGDTRDRRRTLVQVGTLEDQLRGLSTELERNLLEVAVRGSLHDLAACDRASRESDLVDVLVGSKGGATHGAEGRHSVHDARRESGYPQVNFR